MSSLFNKYGMKMFVIKVSVFEQLLYAQNHKNQKKRPPDGGLKNTNDEKNLFRKIQTEIL